MSVPYNAIIREVAIRINAITGSVPATLETNYIVSPLTTTQVVSSIFSLTAITDAVLDTEGTLAKAIADTGNSPLREYLAGQTSSLANLATLPSLSSASKPIVGAWGTVVDASTGQVYSLMPLDEVRRRAANANSQFVVPVYWYFIADRIIEHTGTNVIIKCCVYSRSDQATTLAANGNVLLSDALASAYVAGAVSILVRDDEFVLQAKSYADYFANALSSIKSGEILLAAA